MPAVNLYLSDENYQYLRRMAGGGKLSAAANRALDMARSMSPDSELLARAAARAKARGIPLSRYIEDALSAQLKRDAALDLIRPVDMEK
jgi:post-segregation antitoxin (ccd killing protein)